MMNLSPMGGGFGGNSSSSSSNLSALAPPFTVDRLNPNFNSSPLLHYPDSSYMVEPFDHAWQYARPSAPGPELVSHSTGETGARFSEDYRFSASASIGPSSAHWSAPSPRTQASGSSFTYDGEIKPYYSPYVPPLIEEDRPLVLNQGSRYNFVPAAGVSRTSQLDYTPTSFDLEYGSQWADNLGFDDEKRAKRVELDGNLLSDKVNIGGSSSHNQFDQGGYSCGTWNKSKEEFDFAYPKFNKGYGPEFHTGALDVGHMEAKHIVKDFCLFSEDSKKSNILESSSTYQESHPSILPRKMHNNISDHKSSYPPFDKCIRPDDTASANPLSVPRSSTTVVIRAPPSNNVNFGQSALSYKPTHDNNVERAHTVDFGHHNPVKQKDFGLESSFKINEHYPEANLINFSKEGDGLFPSTSVKELSSVLHSAGTFDDKINTRCVPKLPALTVPGGSAVVCGTSADVTSDCVDTYNLGVDSPCWKGAPYSKLSQFDVESGNIKKLESVFGEYSGFDQEVNQDLHPTVGFDCVSSKNTGQGNKNIHNESARTDGVLKLEKTVDAHCSSDEQGLLDDARCHVQISTTTNSEGVKVGADTNVMRKESSPPNDLSGYDLKGSNTKQLVDEEGAGMIPTYASEGGDVVVHAAEKVLDSPASEDAADEHPKLPDTKLNVPTVVKAIHNLSELLLLHLSNHADSLDGESTETLKCVISNLDLCLSKNFIQASDRPESNKPVGDTQKIGEFCSVGAESHATNEAGKSNIILECGSMRDEEVGAFSFSGQCSKKDRKLPNLATFTDDSDMSGDGDAAKAIKKILEENFHFDEEMHSQAHLFKSLWLEAEAKLCSISYKARFDRMKILMEETKLQAPQALKVPSKVCDGTNTKSALQDYSVSRTGGNAGGVEAFVMERFNILKSRGENVVPVNVEEEQQPYAGARFNGLKSFEGNAKPISVEEERGIVDDGHATSVMARFNILKSREGNSKLISVEEERDQEQEPEMVSGAHAPSVMMHYNILKSREGNSETAIVGDKQSEVVDGDFPGGKYAIRSRSEKDTLKVAQIPDFQNQIGSLGLDGGKPDSYVDELHLSVRNGPIIHPFNSSDIISQGSRNGSSDWEHVLKDEVTWKNF